MRMEIVNEVGPSDARTHLRYPFEIREPSAALHIRFAYAPKTLEDRESARRLMEQSIAQYVTPEQRERALENVERYYPLKNLITISVDDAQGYRGACHRQDPEQLLFLSEREASPGLYPGPIAPGQWCVTLSLHAVVTAKCGYKLEIWTEEETQP
ncbi:hypothetical protein [Cohnella sp. REN36]|uniref:hypothetical protein n=1 Tax=Cohnella sp. REN36 TaxID=2887347 RepID=UPI001D1448A4|nr:hypothetical protein [Cohnella sp. REN36]MCC3372741.1 hypothetical protein [Cohnella sp. REN36]